MNSFRTRKIWALELVESTRETIMNLDSPNREEQYWGLDTINAGLGEWKIELESCMKQYLFTHADPGCENELLFYEFDKTFGEIDDGLSTPWREDILYQYIMEYVDEYQSQILALLGWMVSKPDRTPRKRAPYCELVGELIRQEYAGREIVGNGFEPCKPHSVLQIFIGVFDNNGNFKNKTQLVGGAARCVSKLSKTTAEHMGKNDWVID
ncbi:hypothetical protein GGR58DRAFT_503162 [Xylaria digitata]|nr:hypothetical protein GGR58DRAFT_503162 [Xylaria digitata]